MVENDVSKIHLIVYECYNILTETHHINENELFTANTLIIHNDVSKMHSIVYEYEC